MPDRILREKITRSSTLANLSAEEERFFFRLLTTTDNFGCFQADIRMMRAECFPLQLSTISEADVRRWFQRLVAEKAVVSYHEDGKRYGKFTTWEKYNRLRFKHPKFPMPTSDNICEHPPTCVGTCVGTCQRTSTHVNGSQRTSTHVNGSQRTSADVDVDVESDNRTASQFSSDSPSEIGPERSNDASPKEEGLTPDELAEAWNEIAPGLGLKAVREVRGSRRKKALLRIHEHPELEFWQTVFAAIPKSVFLLGQVKGKNGAEPWRVHFDFLVENDVNATKIAEGRYA